MVLQAKLFVTGVMSNYAPSGLNNFSIMALRLNVQAAHSLFTPCIIQNTHEISQATKVSYEGENADGLLPAALHCGFEEFSETKNGQETKGVCETQHVPRGRRPSAPPGCLPRLSLSGSPSGSQCHTPWVVPLRLAARSRFPTARHPHPPGCWRCGTS